MFSSAYVDLVFSQYSEFVSKLVDGEFVLFQ